MGATRNTGYLENLIAYDASNNVAIATTAIDNAFKITMGGSVKMTGALTGTSATFSGNLNLQGAVTRNINFYDSSNTNINAQIQYDQISSNSGQLFFGTNNAGTFATRLTISNTGAATFSSSVRSNSHMIVSDGSASVVLQGYINNALRIAASGSGSSGGSRGDLYAGATDLNSLVVDATTLVVDATNDRVGIGTTSPLSILHITGQSGTTGLPSLLLYGESPANGQRYGFNVSADQLDISALGTNARIAFFTGGAANSITERMRITSGGNVGIGSTNPTSISTFRTLEIQGSTGAGIRLWNGTNGCNIQHDGTDAYLNNFANGSIYFYTNNAPSMRITSGGNVLIGTTSDSAGVRLKVSGGIIGCLDVYNNTTAVAANVNIDANGFFARSTSSSKYKNSITNYDKGLDIVNQLRPVYYKGNNDGDKQFAGLIAEEVHNLGLTEFVQYAEDGSPDALAYQNMVALLTKAIQELNQKIQALENK